MQRPRHCLPVRKGKSRLVRSHCAFLHLADAYPEARNADIVDYIETLHFHHFGHNESPAISSAKRNRQVARLMRAQELARLAPLMEQLAEWQRQGRVRILGPGLSPQRAPTVALETRRNPREVAETLAERDIWVGAGDFHAVRTLRALGVQPARGVLRLSFLHYTTKEECERLLAALDAIL